MKRRAIGVGFGSTLAAASLARIVIVCSLPFPCLARRKVMNGELQAWKGRPSTLHSKVAPGVVEVKRIRTFLRFLWVRSFFGLPARITVDGGPVGPDWSS